MTINNKFNVGDKVFLLVKTSDRQATVKVTWITALVVFSENEVSYRVANLKPLVDEQDLIAFNDKEMLASALQECFADIKVGEDW